MPEPAENYTPVNLAAAVRRQATRVWAWTLGLVGIWVALIVLPAVLASAGVAGGVGAWLFGLFGWICHQLPDRSFHLEGHQLGVCTRCFGVYFGLLAGIAVYPIWRRVEEIEPLPRIWLFLAMIPIAIDWSLTIFGVWENTHLTRFITGAILGLACATYILPALVEIVRYFARPAPARIAA